MTDPLEQSEVAGSLEQSEIAKFDTLEKPDIIEIAREFGTEFNPKEAKKTIIARMVGEGVTWQMYNDLRVVPEDEPIELAELDDTPLTDEPAIQKPQEEEILLKMTRNNFTYEVRGYRFTKQHPFALVKEEDADYLIESGGFRPASPREFASFYGQG